MMPNTDSILESSVGYDDDFETEFEPASSPLLAAPDSPLLAATYKDEDVVSHKIVDYLESDNFEFIQDYQEATNNKKIDSNPQPNKIAKPVPTTDLKSAMKKPVDSGNEDGALNDYLFSDRTEGGNGEF